MRSRLIGSLVVLAALVAATAALAGEVVYFTNGTAMTVQSHKVEGNTITVTLSNKASIAFPQYLVERIERAGKSVYPSRSGSRPANQAAVGQDEEAVIEATTGPVTAESSVPSRYRARSSGSRNRGTDVMDKVALAAMEGRENGEEIDTFRPMAGHPNVAARSLRVTGSRSAFEQSPGAPGEKVGNRYVLEGHLLRRTGAPRLEPRFGSGAIVSGSKKSGSASVAPAEPAEETEAAESDSVEADSGSSDASD